MVSVPPRASDSQVAFHPEQRAATRQNVVFPPFVGARALTAANEL
jgi:hypothetical protein